MDEKSLHRLTGKKIWVYAKGNAYHADLLFVGDGFIRIGINGSESDEFSENIMTADIEKITTDTAPG